MIPAASTVQPRSTTVKKYVALLSQKNGRHRATHCRGQIEDERARQLKLVPLLVAAHELDAAHNDRLQRRGRDLLIVAEPAPSPGLDDFGLVLRDGLVIAHPAHASPRAAAVVSALLLKALTLLTA